MSSPRTAVHPAGARTGTRGPGTRRRPPARKHRRGGRDPLRNVRRQVARWWPAALVVAAVLAGVAWDTRSSPALPAGTCTVSGSSVTLTSEQATNATTIADVGRARGLPDRAIVIALATAQQESRLRNLDYGDRDSLGLFQQRPSQGWGTPEQVRDPVYAAGIFYDRLVQVPNWDTMRLTDAAQSVQLSGFPELYQQWQEMAEALAGALSPEGGSGLLCS